MNSTNNETTTTHVSRSQIVFKRPEKTSQLKFDKGTDCYLGSIIDEMGLSMAAFRLYLHLTRRAGLTAEDGRKWRQGKFKRTAIEGRVPIAAWCRMDKNTVTAATKELEKANLISVYRNQRGRTSDTNIYTLLPPSVWCTWVSVENSSDQVPF
jgi:DNA-binding MarR family transcriptional regulator